MKVTYERIDRALEVVIAILMFLILHVSESPICLAQEKPKLEKSVQQPLSFDEVFPDPFLRAIVLGRTWIVSAVLEKGQPPNVAERSEMRLTPILLAVYYEREDIFRILIAHKANIEAKDNLGINPLMYACYRQNLALAETLIDAGAKVNAQADGGTTPLMIAANLGNLPLVRFLLHSGGNINSTTDIGATILMVSADDERVNKELLDAKADVNIRDDAGWTALFHAIDKGQSGKVNFLLRHGASVDIKDKSGLTPRELTLRGRDPEIKAAIIKLLDENDQRKTGRESGRSVIFLPDRS